MKGFIEITKKEERISIAISNIAAVSEKEAGCIISLNSPIPEIPLLSSHVGPSIELKTTPYEQILNLITQAQ
jgi:hypothetical protein